MVKPQKIKPEWKGKPCFVAAPGPGLTLVTAKRIFNTGWNVLVCQDAWRMMPWAHKMYGCDEKWWRAHKGTGFEGEKWSSHDKVGHSDDKLSVAEKYGINLVRGRAQEGFSTDPEFIHYGDNSGFQALNLAVLLGSHYIVMVGYDMRHVGGKSHFFGDHPNGLFQRNEYESFVKHFEKAPAPEGVSIVNATPDSAVQCYPMMKLEDAIKNYSVHWHRAVTDARANQYCEEQGLHPVRV